MAQYTGKSIPIAQKSEANPIWEDIDPEKLNSLTRHIYSSYDALNNTIRGNTILYQTPSLQFNLDIETLEPDYENNIYNFGLMLPNTTVIKSNIDKRLRINLLPSKTYQHVDTNEQSTRLKWKWNPTTLQYDNIGFYKITFDYDIQFSANFVFELLDNNGTVVWSKTSTGGVITGIGQIVSFKSLSWEFRLRCNTNYTTSTSTTYHAQVSNIKIERYKDIGTVELSNAKQAQNINTYERIEYSTLNPQGTNVNTQLSFSDDNVSYSTFSGYDGTPATYYNNNITNKITVPYGYVGNYYKWKLTVTSDGRESPSFYSLIIDIYTKNIFRPLDLSKQSSYATPNPGMTVPIPLNISNIVAFTDISYDNGAVCKAIHLIRSDIIQWLDFFGPRILYGKSISVLKAYLESIVGQVVSGYIVNMNNDIIKNAISIMIMSTGKNDLNQVGNVNPDTGFYQIFVKNTIYDERYVIIQLGINKGLALNGAGIPPVIDGSQKLDIPYNIQFACPTIDCDFSITRDI